MSAHANMDDGSASTTFQDTDSDYDLDDEQ